jgi:FixJ family two-component response regulator
MQTASLTRETRAIADPHFRSPISLSLDGRTVEPTREIVYLVGHHLLGGEPLSVALGALGMKAVGFESGRGYLEHARRDEASCLILELQLSDMSGLDLQRRLAGEANPPVIFISDQCDVGSAVRAMKAGAIEFLGKSFDLPALIAAIRTAFAQDRRRRKQKAKLAKLRERFALLTPRERDVLPLILGGLLNKQAASVLGISEVTLQIHRSHAMRKMQAGSFAEFVRMATKLRIPYWREPISGDSQRGCVL